MKHLLASCAVVALMAAPALAQSTYYPTEPVDPAAVPEAMTDPTAEEDADVEVDADVESSTGVTVTREPDTYAEDEDGVTAEDETVAEAEPEGQAEDATSTASADESVDAPIDVAELPAEYSTEDLNALMLAQLNEEAVEIASIVIESEAEALASTETGTPAGPATDAYASTERDTPAAAETESYASSETGIYTAPESGTDALPETDMEMAETAQPDDPSAQEYASAGSNTYAAPDTDMVPDEAPVMPESHAAIEPVDPVLGETTAGAGAAMNEEAVSPEEEAAEMAEQSGETKFSAEGDIDQNAVEIAEGDSRFSTLVELVGIAGLEDEFSADGPYTVFAPTNEAFAALPKETLARLKSEAGKVELAEILKAHVVEGAVMAGEVPMAGKTVETLANTSVNVSGSTDGTLNIAGTTHTVGDGIFASNGVVYPVDAVILPETPPT